jgi:error-prone DNA polymerase
MRQDGQTVRIAGQNVMHQAPPTAKGFHFITLEDENGCMYVIVRPQVYLHYRRVRRNNPPLIVEGEVQRKDEVINVLCKKAEPLRSVSR